MADSKRVICLSTAEIFDSVGEAAKSAGVQSSEMSRAVNGKRGVIKGRIYELLPDDYDPDYPEEVYAARRLIARFAEFGKEG